MNLKQAHHMITVFREGNITNAAKKLGISQPSLSQMIKLTEANLGAPIFNRTTDPITLTYAGQRYIEAAKKMLSIHANLTNEIGEINNESSGQLRLGISMQRGMQLLPILMPTFMELYPHVEVLLEEHGSSTLESMTREGTVDLALVTTDPQYSELQYVFLEHETLMLLSDKRTELARRCLANTPINLSQAKDESFIALRAGHSVRSIQDRIFQAAEISPRIKLETNSFEAAKYITIASRSVMLCPHVYLENDPEIIRDGVCFPVLGNPHPRDFYVCFRNDLYLTRYMKDLMAILQYVLKKHSSPPLDVFKKI